MTRTEQREAHRAASQSVTGTVVSVSLHWKPVSDVDRVSEGLFHPQLELLLCKAED